ncbi:hypothetical protein L3Q82_018402, partial [Scortum barcoo]
MRDRRETGGSTQAFETVIFFDGLTSGVNVSLRTMPASTTRSTFTTSSRKITTALFIRDADLTLSNPTTSPTAEPTSSTEQPALRCMYVCGVCLCWLCMCVCIDVCVC